MKLGVSELMRDDDPLQHGREVVIICNGLDPVPLKVKSLYGILAKSEWLRE